MVYKEFSPEHHGRDDDDIFAKATGDLEFPSYQVRFGKKEVLFFISDELISAVPYSRFEKSDFRSDYKFVRGLMTEFKTNGMSGIEDCYLKSECGNE